MSKKKARLKIAPPSPFANEFSASETVTLLHDPPDSLEVNSLIEEMHANLDRVGKLTVADILIPRTDIIGLNIGSSNKELLKILSEYGFSRYPVYQETLDAVTGVVHVKDIYRAFGAGEKIRLEKLQNPAQFVSPGVSLLDLLLEMREKRTHLALVVGEYGGHDGPVTIDDILEQNVGAIEDEHDDSSEAPIIHDTPGTWLTSARIRLERLESEIGKFQTPDNLREDVETLGGLLYGMLGRIPKPGELIRHSGGLTFEIVEADQRKIRSVRVRKISE